MVILSVPEADNLAPGTVLLTDPYFFFGSVFGAGTYTCSFSVVRGWFSAYRRVVNLPSVALRKTVFFVVMSRSSFLRRSWPPERDDSLSKSSTKVTREETNVRAFLSFVSLLQRFPALQASRTYQHPTSVGPPRLDQAGRVRFKSQQEHEGRSPSFFMLAKGRASRPGLECRSLGVDAPVLEQPGTDCAHAALVCRGELLKRSAGIERGE